MSSLHRAVPDERSGEGLLARAVPWLALLTAAGLFVRMFDNPGTADVSQSWILWMQLTRTLGPLGAFIEVGPDYPPLAFASFYGLTRIADWFSTTDFNVLKGSLYCGALAGVAVYGWWTKHSLKTASLLWALLVEAACLAYLDAWTLAPMLLAVVALERRRSFAAGVMLGVASSLKFQPLIVGPFFLLEACRPRGARAGFPVPEWRRLILFCAGGGLVLAAQALTFGPEQLVQSIGDALGHQQLTNQALNANWIVHVALGGSINTPDTGMLSVVAMRTAKAVFIAAYLLLVVTFWLRRSAFRDFPWYAAAGGTMYFVFNTGVHENHLFIAMVMAFALLAVDTRTGWPFALFTGISMTANLVAFYALDGQPAYYTSIFNQAAVVIALANVAFGLLLIWSAVAHLRRGMRTVTDSGAA
jgi:hypothetical protein